MTITWLGQAGLLLAGAGVTVLIDPYLSDALRETGGDMYARMTPADTRFADARPDFLLLTHAHGDHTDLPTLRRILSREEGIDVLASGHAYDILADDYALRHTMIRVSRGVEWTRGGVCVRAVLAVHSDETAVGYVVQMAGKRLYITGDTLYHRDIPADVGKGIDYMLPCMNGKGNNMNPEDAARLTNAIAPRAAFPVHYGMFASYHADPDLYIAALNGKTPARRLPLYQAYDPEEMQAI